MRFIEALNEKEGTPEASIEYFRKPHFGYDKEDRANLAVKLNQLSLMSSRVFKLKDFWDKQKESKLIDQFVKATFRLGKEYGVVNSNKQDFDTYKYIIENLFSREKKEADIIFNMEPGFNFKGLFKGDKFSIAKVRHDEGEAKTGAWASKERKELEKLNK